MKRRQKAALPFALAVAWVVPVVVQISESSEVLAFTSVPHPPAKVARSFGSVHPSLSSPFQSGTSWSLSMVPLMPDDVATATSLLRPSTSLFLSEGSAIVDTIQSIAVVVTAVLFALAGLTLLMANIIIPAAANELEKECRELAPDLWNEYQAKLEPGQTMATRPDLMQELGAKLQPLLDAKIAKMELDKSSNGSSSPGPSSDSPMAKIDEDDETWTTSVDLSAITDRIEVPSKKAAKDDDAEQKSESC